MYVVASDVITTRRKTYLHVRSIESGFNLFLNVLRLRTAPKVGRRVRRLKSSQLQSPLTQHWWCESISSHDQLDIAVSKLVLLSCVLVIVTITYV